MTKCRKHGSVALVNCNPALENLEMIYVALLISKRSVQLIREKAGCVVLRFVFRENVDSCSASKKLFFSRSSKKKKDLG